MNRPRVLPARLGHAPCSATCGCCKRHAKSFARQMHEDGAEQRGLAATRSARDDEDALAPGRFQCFELFAAELKGVLLGELFKRVGDGSEGLVRHLHEPRHVIGDGSLRRVETCGRVEDNVSVGAFDDRALGRESRHRALESGLIGRRAVHGQEPS